MQPLEDIRILAISQFGAGPYGMMQLADLGAEVIKIEHPAEGGDSARQVPPHTIAGDSLYFQSLNRNMRTLSLNLQHPDGQALFHDLVKVSDAVFSNLRGDQPERLSLTYNDLKQFNRRIVCVSLTGFGASGPRRAEPGYDYLIQAYAGFMSLTGEPDGPPARAGVSVVDFSGGLAAALGLVSGVLAARRTGEGGDVDVSLLDTAISMLNYLASWTLNGDYEPKRLPDSSHPTLYPSQVFGTSDGHLVIMCAKEKFWTALVNELDQPELADDPRFRTFADRYRNREALTAILKAAFGKQPTSWWLARLRNKVPCAPVNSVVEALQDEQVLERELLVTVDHPDFGPMLQTASAVRFPGSPGTHAPAARVGGDNDAILGDYLGLSQDQIADLHQRGVI
jgi:crotonobetainyl-CoA:carnitine CoA-transferase CaiB-like acyl-CoA transferase